MRKELLQGLSEEQIKKVESCESSEEILALAKSVMISLKLLQVDIVVTALADVQAVVLRILSIR